MPSYFDDTTFLSELNSSFIVAEISDGNLVVRDIQSMWNAAQLDWSVSPDSENSDVRSHLAFTISSLAIPIKPLLGFLFIGSTESSITKCAVPHEPK